MQKTRNLIALALCLVLCSFNAYYPPEGLCGPEGITFSTDNGDFPAGQMTQWTVPAGVTEITIATVGGDGATFPNGGTTGGSGAEAKASFSVTPGDVLHVIVAGSPFAVSGGGGGTGVYNATTGVVLIAAGGGGAAAYNGYGQGGQSTEAGGNNNGLAAAGGTNGSGGGSGDFFGGGGGGAFSAGSGGSGGGQGVPNGGNGGGSFGAFGFGGGGAGFVITPELVDFDGGAGGGGGYSGGGGGDIGEAGGGGGSFVHASGTNATITPGVTGGGGDNPGSVTLCYVPTPACDLAIDNITPTAESCPGANDGSLSISASCTTCAGIEYSIDGVNFQASNSFSGLAPGTYTVTVRDTGDPACEATDNTTVNGGPATDSDNDGTADCNDGCPNDPNKTAPGTCGCGVADTDSDGDGVPDCNDNCVNTANPGQEDGDGDGIGNACDACPTIPVPECATCGNGKYLVCHVPAGNPNNVQQLCININAANAHIGNHGGCFWGYCNPPIVAGGKKKTMSGATIQQQKAGISTENSSSNNEATVYPNYFFEISPNPATDALNIHLHGHGANSLLLIHDQLGRIMWQQALEEEVSEFKINLSDSRFVNGFYTVNIFSNGERISKPFVILK